jgi:insertion element IS1 protein InsB
VQAEAITCPRCSARNIKKNGTAGNGKQRYCCRRCGRQFVARYSYRGRDPAVRRLVVPLALNGCGVRDTARVLGVSPTTVLKLLKARAARVRRQPLPARLIELELDELWSFIGDKAHQAWLWYAFDPRSRQVVAWTVGRRTDETCRRLLRQLRRCRVLRFCTDDWESYAKLIPEAHHWVGKQWTQGIERQNLNFRTHLKRLHRRTICFSKSAEMHEAVLKLYIEHHNRQHQM